VRKPAEAPTDSRSHRRQRALTITRAGRQLLDSLQPGALRLRERLLAPLTRDERRQFMALLAKLVSENNERSRAPLARRGSAA
jgi:DNA-binding MarR family transcriptional regulator